MSIRANIEKLCWEARQNINKDLSIKIENKYGFGDCKYVYAFDIEEDDVKIPFSYGIFNLKLTRPSREVFPKVKIEFVGKLREEQKEVKKEAISCLSKTGSVLLSMYCGFGKSATSMNLACVIGFKTLIIVNKLVLIKQWEEGINNFCPEARVVKLTGKNKVGLEGEFYIVNAQNVCKISKEILDDIGTVIVDEAHLIMAETLSRCLQYVHPRYLIGLSATPYRLDGLNCLLSYYFGNYKIVRNLWREHTAYKVMTRFKPIIEYANNGKVNWGIVLDSQANDVSRNELIIKLVKYFSDRNFLILTKRIVQGEYLVNRLLEEDEDVTSLIGNNQTFDNNSRILIGTSSKIGVGFDHPKLDALLLAADVEDYFIQYLGRVFRTKEVEPIIIDLVDNYSVLNKHFLSRQKIYQEHGGKVKTFDINKLE